MFNYPWWILNGIRQLIINIYFTCLKTYQARQQFLFSGPGGLLETGNSATGVNEDAQELVIDEEDGARSFTVEKSLRWDNKFLLTLLESAVIWMLECLWVSLSM